MISRVYAFALFFSLSPLVPLVAVHGWQATTFASKRTTTVAVASSAKLWSRRGAVSLRGYAATRSRIVQERSTALILLASENPDDENGEGGKTSPSSSSPKSNGSDEDDATPSTPRPVPIEPLDTPYLSEPPPLAPDEGWGSFSFQGWFSW